ncbi:MAG: type II secretion system protein GspM [Pseudomonadales bacterium]
MSLFYRVSQQVQGTAAWRWYASREPHERPVIAGLLLLVILAVLWIAIWKPISDWRAVEANRYQNAQSTWEWMQANESKARARATQVGGAQTSDRSLMPLVTREANTLGIRLNRLQPESDGAVSVVVQAQPFNTLVQWLDRLQSTHNIAVQRISVDAEGKPGLVNAQIRLI